MSVLSAESTDVIVGHDAKVQAMTRSLRARGADDATVQLCLGMSRLDEIIENNRDRKKHVVVFSFPKSGSTYLHRLLLASTGYVDYLLDHCSEDHQQTLVQQWAPMFLAQNTVSQIHAFATAPNMRLIKTLGIRPVVMVRNLFDALVSLRDHIMNEDYVIPVAQIPIEFREWSQTDQFWFLARMAAPWYLNSFVSWQRAAKTNSVLWTRYDELVADPFSTIKRVLAHATITCDEHRIRKAIAECDPRTVRFNVGVSGRGASLLSPAQQRAIRETAAVYRDTCDFSMVGL